METDLIFSVLKSPGRENSKCKGPEVGKGLGVSGNLRVWSVLSEHGDMVMETIFSSWGQPRWTSSCWGRDRHYGLASPGPGGGTCKLLLLQEEPRAVRWIRATAHSPSFWTRGPSLAVTCQLCPWSQPLSDKRLSLACVLTPPWPGQVASSLGGQ